MGTNTDLDPDTVFQILQDSDAITFAHVIADICATRGWKPDVTVADSNYVADIVASRSLPFPESVSLIRYDDGELTKRRLEGLLDRGTHDPSSKLAVIVHRPPSRDAVQLARTHGVGIIGLSDIAESIVMLSLENLLKAHVENDESLYQQYAYVFDQSSTSNEQGTDESSAGTTPATKSGDIADEGTAVSPEFQDADFSTIKLEIEAVYDAIRDDLAELEARIVQNPDLLITDEFEQSPIVATIKKGTNRVKGVLLMSEIDPAVVEQASQANKDGVNRIQELYVTYEDGDLKSQRGQTPEQTLFEYVVKTVDKMESNTLAVGEDAADN
jgi:hypothetical protein